VPRIGHMPEGAAGSLRLHGAEGARRSIRLDLLVALRLAGRAHQPVAGADAAAAEVAAGIARLTSKRSSGVAFGTFGLTEARSFVTRA
jgi:hypothetical protein